MFRAHKEETRRREQRLRERRKALGGLGLVSAGKDLTAMAAAQAKGVADLWRSDKPVQNARDAFVTEHLEIAARDTGTARRARGRRRNRPGSPREPRGGGGHGREDRRKLGPLPRSRPRPTKRAGGGSMTRRGTRPAGLSYPREMCEHVPSKSRERGVSGGFEGRDCKEGRSPFPETGKGTGSVADSLFEGETTGHSERTYWVVARRDAGQGTPLVVTLPDGGEALPVFSFEEEAEMFLWFVENGNEWLASEVSGGELLSMLFGDRAVAENVALDPSPEIVDGMAVGLVTLSRERFVSRIVDADDAGDHAPARDTASWLPPGYDLDRSDPDVLFLRRWDGSSVAAFSARGATRAGIAEAVEDDSGLALW